MPMPNRTACRLAQGSKLPPPAEYNMVIPTDARADNNSTRVQLIAMIFWTSVN